MDESKTDPVIYGMEDETPSFYDHLNPDLPPDQRYNWRRLIETKEVRVTEAVYWHFLEIMPPLYFANRAGLQSFCVCEAITESTRGTVIASQFQDRGGEYFHQYVEISNADWEKAGG